ncbi:hypothetical protein MESS2_1640016 [Mesorhizobium metallidurans STM 2683]|uniref:Uncharacterized protein n=1 Tax=Mesorhizobium metallidurans STM 2683 TaxID=1297569 RepID=M5ENF6_9HYPH|nr:hypothetical protein MESS2_1640016 [Mesorhizobium metallidurans STM 2683]
MFPLDGSGHLSQPGASHVQCHINQQPELSKPQPAQLHDRVCFGGRGNAADGTADESRRTVICEAGGAA